MRYLEGASRNEQQLISAHDEESSRPGGEYICGNCLD